MGKRGDCPALMQYNFFEYKILWFFYTKKRLSFHIKKVNMSNCNALLSPFFEKKSLQRQPEDGEV